MIAVSNADRVVFPAVGRTKGDVVAYYEAISGRASPHVVGRPLSIYRFPKGLAAPGFFQKNVPKHYPASIARFEAPRQGGVTVYPVLSEPEHVPYVANQGAIELHATTSGVANLDRPDRVVIDLDPPPGEIDLVRRAAFLVKDFLEAMGLACVPVATGSKGYHLVTNIRPDVNGELMATTMHHAAALLAHRHPAELTIAFRTAARGKRVFIDWLRNRTMATVVTPFSLRARPRASVAVPLAWSELETTAPDAFTIADQARLLDRPDPLLASPAVDARPFIDAIAKAFEASGLVLERFDRFRS